MSVKRIFTLVVLFAGLSTFAGTGGGGGSTADFDITPTAFPEAGEQVCFHHNLES